MEDNSRKYAYNLHPSMNSAVGWAAGESPTSNGDETQPVMSAQKPKEKYLA
jgi:hypothetical protein